MQEIKDQQGRSIFIVDNVLTVSEHNYLYNSILRSNFNIGFEDTEAIERLSNKYLHSVWNPTVLKECGFIDALKNTEIWNIISDLEVKRIIINLSVPSDTYYPHCHKDELALIYYANMDWKPEWGGETIFFEENLQDIVYASLYKPGRLILADGNIPHTIRSQSDLAPHYRFSLAMFFKK